MKLRNIYYASFLTTLILIILKVSQPILLPFIIALALYFIITIISDYLKELPFISKISIPPIIFRLISIGIILYSLYLFVNLVSSNISNVLKIAPSYQSNLDTSISKIYDALQIDNAPNLKEFLLQLNLNKYIQDLGGSLRKIISSTGIIIVYLLFILFEEHTFKRKINSIVSKTSKHDEIFIIASKIKSDLNSYIGIKLLTSLATAVVSYVILSSVGVDFASFWALLIFLLNFIPTLGSIIATIFPSLIALIQFDTLTPVIITITLLSVTQFIIGSLVEPKLLGQKLNLSPLIIILSLGLWGYILGFVGLFFSVPLTVGIMITCSYFKLTRPLAVLLSGNGNIPDLLDNKS